jgi:UDPglucose--hexose-1-phosphate uridylyltransferase
MSVRRKLLGGDPIVYAPGRAGRPNAFTGGTAGDLCAFCPGNEAETPPTIASIPHPGGTGWMARAFANKFPAAEGHEVIVESERQDDTFDTLRAPDLAVGLMLERYAAHPAAAHVALFKNQGRLAGASLPHMHSQLIPLPFVPPRVAGEALSFHDHCPLCDVASAGEPIADDGVFTWLAPYGSVMAHQTWLVPKTHANEPRGDAGVAHLAAMLQRASRAMLQIADAYNWSFTTFRCEPRGHWYVDLLPRLTTIAGFELGTGSFILIIDPADTARRFRDLR